MLPSTPSSMWSLDSTDQFAIRLEEIACQQKLATPPAYVTALLEYGPTTGRDFVEISYRPVASRTRCGVCQTAGELGADLPPARYTTGAPSASLELAGSHRGPDRRGVSVSEFRALLSEGFPAQALQAATGWGGDSYRLLSNGSDVVLVVLFEGDEVRDARELAETLGGWASASLDVGAAGPTIRAWPLRAGYAFVAHDDTTMLLVLSGDAGAGRRCATRSGRSGRRARYPLPAAG